MKNNILYNSTPQNEILIYKSSKICRTLIRGKLQNSDERNQRTSKQIERYPKFMDWENQIVKMLILLKLMKQFNASITTSAITTSASYFASVIKLILMFIQKVRRSTLANTILKKTEQSWRTHVTQF